MVDDVDFEEHFPHIIPVLVLKFCPLIQSAILEESNVATFQAKFFIKSLIVDNTVTFY